MIQPTLQDIFAQAQALIDSASKFDKTLSTAESCTGGLIGAAITAIDGASAVFKGGIIAYDNSVKTSHLDVRAETLKAEGAVSDAVCRQMAIGAMTHLRTDIAVSVTGIAGPAGGSPEKPVGTVWMGIAWKKDKKVLSEAHLLNFGNIGRNKVRDATVFAAMRETKLKLLDLYGPQP